MPKKKVPASHIIYGTKKKTAHGRGRLIAVDFRDKNFLLKKRKAEVRKKYWETGDILDQGIEGQCVAYAWEQYLMSAPTFNEMYKTPEKFYRECQKADEFAGEDYEGTSTRAGAKVLKRAGYIESYNWAFESETVSNYLLTTGPVVIGSDWLESMDDPDKDGFLDVDPNSEPRGGHTYLLVGTNLDVKCPNGDTGAVRVANSWGDGWADDGFAWISLNDLDWLLKNGGEACTAIEIEN